MKQFSSDFIYQLMSLIVAILLVHAIYVAVIRPNANSLLEVLGAPEQMTKQGLLQI